MQLRNPTLRRLDRLSKLGCAVTIRGGVAHASVADLLLAGVSAVLHAGRVWTLRQLWSQNRHMDRCHRLGPDAFRASYLIVRHQCWGVLPNAWFQDA